MNWSFGMIKPDGVSAKEEIFFKIKSRGLEIVLSRKIYLKERQVKALYKRHLNKEFYSSMKEFLISGPVVVFVVKGKNAIQKLNELVGFYDPKKAKKDTIRNQFGTDIQENVIHSSYNQKDAIREVKIFLKAKNLKGGYNNPLFFYCYFLVKKYN